MEVQRGDGRQVSSLPRGGEPRRFKGGIPTPSLPCLEDISVKL
jgi:hypothetical protein